MSSSSQIFSCIPKLLAMTLAFAVVFYVLNPAFYWQLAKAAVRGNKHCNPCLCDCMLETKESMLLPGNNAYFLLYLCMNQREKERKREREKERKRERERGVGFSLPRVLSFPYCAVQSWTYKKTCISVSLCNSMIITE